MAGPSLRGDSPRGRAPAGTGGAVTGIPAIVVLLVLGLILRFIIAYVLLPGSGFPNDLGAFQAWGNDIAQHGPIGFYERQSFIDYPPVYLLLLGAVSLLTGGSIGEGVKLVPILADLGLAAVVWLMATELGVNHKRALIAAFIVLINPITWFNSAIWGQADSVGSILLLLGLRELQKDRRESASALAVLAVLTKMQLGILGFVVGFVVLRRSIAPKTGRPEPERILSSIGAGLITAALVCLPFTGLSLVGNTSRIATGPGLATIGVGLVAGLGVFFLGRRQLPIADARRRLEASFVLGVVTAYLFASMVFDSIVSHLVNTFGEYPYLTLNAYNPWALVSDGGSAMDRTLSWLHDAPWVDAQSGASGTGYVIGPFPATVVLWALGLVVLLLVAALASWRLRRRPVAAAAGPAGTDVAASSGRGARSVAARWLAAEFSGLTGVFVVAAALIAAIVIVAASGQLYAVALGDGLLVAALVGVGIWAAWRDDPQSLLVALTILAIAFFVAPTRAHERYLYPFFGLGAILLAVSWRWSLTYVILAVVNAANLLAVLVQYNGIPASDGWLAGTLNDWGHGLLTATWFGGIIWPIALCAVVTTLAMVWALLQMRGRAVAALAREVATAENEPESGIWWATIGPHYEEWTPELPAPALPAPVPGGTSPEAPVAASSAAASAAVPVAAASAALLPVASESRHGPGGDDEYQYDEFELSPDDEYWAEGEEYLEGPDRPIYVPGRVMRVWHRLARPSRHPDRSASLESEPRGRIDKLDIWVVVALVAVILSMRVYRLDEPLQMHFDEVYHARSATEFLQDWRYNIPHDIYEWTHPMLAKYAIAGGITLFSDDKVTATADLNVAVKAILVQPRTLTSPIADPNNPDARSGGRYGDRFFLATGSDVRVYDLQTRAQVETYAIAGATAFSSVGPTGLVYVGTSSGRIYSIDTNSLDDVQNGLASTAKPPVELTVSTGLAIAHLYSGTPPFILASDGAGNVVSIDLANNGGTIVARANVPGAADFADLGTGPTVLVKNPGSSATPSTSEAQALASALGTDAAAVQSALDVPLTSSLPQALNVGPLSSAQVTAVQNLVSAGALPGITVEQGNPQVIVAYRDGIGLLDARRLLLTPSIPTDSPATSIAINENSDGSVNYGDVSYVAAGSSIVPIKMDVSGATGTVSQDPTKTPFKMPGAVTQVVFDSATKVAQALGLTPDGKGWTVYAIETNGDAVFSDAKLPGQPVAIGLDSSPQMPDTDREQVLAVAPDGSTATVDVGQFAFSWRIVGVLFGALMAACLYLLARLLFRRRSIGLLVALFSMTDGMLFVQSRIAMNDTYVGGFLLLAYLIFAILWFEVWKHRAAFWVLMPILGVVLGLALASKWVGLYAMASIGMLILIRSALGRLVTILALAGGTGILGWMAIAEMSTKANTGDPVAVVVLIGLAVAVVIGGFVWAYGTRTTPDKVFIAIVASIIAAGLFLAALLQSPGTVENGAPNYTFFIIMLAVTAIAAAANAYHPVAWTIEEMRFAIGAPLVVGGLALIGGLLRGSGLLLEVGAAGLIGGAAAAVGFQYAGRLGFGPLAMPPGPNDPSSYAPPPSPAPTGWLRLGTGFGIPAAFTAFCVVILPIIIYVALYIPWSMPWQPQTDATGPLPAIACWHTDTTTGTCDSAWPAGHTGQNLWQLTISMYNYHNDLRASHAASSPWWAWPLDLKPVWFESISYGPDLGSWIHDGGNPALWWMAIFAMGFIAWQAFKRRSLALTLVTIAFFWQWVSWARIDRATFQYHFYTALPFFLLALAYFLAELWHGPSRRTWLLARIAAASALLLPAALWLLKDPLCTVARVSTTDYFGNSICGSGTGDVNIETRMFLIGVVLVAALAALAIILWRLERRQRAGLQDPFWLVQLLVPVAVAGLLLGWVGQSGSHASLFQVALPPDMMAIVMLVLGVCLAIVTLLARNPRRFVLGVCVFAIAAFLALYPDLSALPLPNAILGIYDGILPTWFYGFQFSVNLQPGNPVALTSGWPLAVAALLVAGFAAWAAWERRVVIGYRLSGRLPMAAQASAADATGVNVTGPDPAGPDATPAGEEGDAAVSEVSPAATSRKTSRKDKPPNERG